MNAAIIHQGRLAACIAAALLMAGCASNTVQPLYGWEGYQPQVYEHLKSGGNAIHCWRHSANGVIADNVRIHDNTGKPVVITGAPAGWAKPEPPVLRNNRNQLSDRPEQKP